MVANIPRLEWSRSFPVRRVLVTRSGVVAGARLSVGDQLVVGAIDDNPGALLLLVPAGWGRPMLGRRVGDQLFAEPGGVPASSRRWRAVGTIVAWEHLGERLPVTPQDAPVQLRLFGDSATDHVRAA